MRLEEWIDVLAGLLDDIGPTTHGGQVPLPREFHILPQLQGRELGSLTFEGNRGMGRPG
jgi:hypothetical protein